jgi:hypothetical protein
VESLEEDSRVMQLDFAMLYEDKEYFNFYILKPLGADLLNIGIDLYRTYSNGMVSDSVNDFKPLRPTYRFSNEENDPLYQGMLTSLSYEHVHHDTQKTMDHLKHIQWLVYRWSNLTKQDILSKSRPNAKKLFENMMNVIGHTLYEYFPNVYDDKLNMDHVVLAWTLCMNMLEMLIYDFFNDNDIQEHIQFNEAFRDYTYGEYLFDIDDMQVFEGIYQVVIRSDLQHVFNEKLFKTIEHVKEFNTYFGHE